MVPTFVFSRSDFQYAPAQVCLTITRQEYEYFSHQQANPPLHPHHRSRMLGGLPLESFVRRIRRVEEDRRVLEPLVPLHTGAKCVSRILAATLRADEDDVRSLCADLVERIPIASGETDLEPIGAKRGCDGERKVSVLIDDKRGLLVHGPPTLVRRGRSINPLGLRRGAEVVL